MTKDLLFTPESVTQLADNEVFVFGSNIAGHHSGGAAKFAKLNFGAIEGQGEGLQGQSYAIPTMHRTLEQIEESVEKFNDFAYNHKELTFYVTEIGCGSAKFKIEDVATLFNVVSYRDNVILPKRFVNVLLRNCASNWFGQKYLEKYTFKVEGFKFAITDLERMTVNIIDGPKFGVAPRSVAFAGDVYKVENVMNEWSPYFDYPFKDINDDTTYLAAGAFFGVYQTSVTFFIPEKLEYYGHCPFPHCGIHSNSTRFEVVDGMVIDKKFHRVIQCIDQSMESIVVPEGVGEIYTGAFFGCRMKSISLPISLKRIGIDAFWNCDMLESITLPKNVEYIGDYCFARCSNLETVKMEGRNVKSGDAPFNRSGVERLLVPKGNAGIIRKNLNSTITEYIEEY